MQYNSKERVLCAFAHEEADRVPAWCGASVEFWEKAKGVLSLDDEGLRRHFNDDFRRVSSRYCGPDFLLSPGAISRTLFGVERAGLGYGYSLKHPLASATLKQINDYPWPDPDWQDISGVRENATEYGGEYAILGGEWSAFWHDAIDLLGMENLYFKMYDNPEIVDAVMGHILDFYFEVSRRTFDVAGEFIDIFFIGNDLGSQTGPLIGDEMFRRFLLPHLKRLIKLGHDYKLKVMMHCCGGFAALIPAMIEAELDGLHALQPDCVGMDLKALKQDFGDKILLNGGIDSTNILIKGTPESVKTETREVLKIMMPGGGYVAGASHDTILEETPLENVLAMFETIAESGEYC